MSAPEIVLETLSELVKRLLPGSVSLLLLGLTVGVVLLLLGEGRKRGFGRVWLTGLAIGYWLLSLPAVTEGLEGWLDAGHPSITSAQEARGAQVIVVLTGGGATLRSGELEVDVLSWATALRMLEAERLYRLLGDPVLLISGGPAGSPPEGNPESQAVRDQLIVRGIPASRIQVEAVSADTHEQAVRIREWAQAEEVETFLLVTSRAHMRRALGAFRQQDLDPIPSVAPDGNGDSPPLGARWLPSSEALARSEQAMREVFALLYYAARGWLG